MSEGNVCKRAGVPPKGKEPPFPRIVIAERNTGIVLDDGGAVLEQKIAHRGEVAGVQEIRRALDQAVAGRERLAKFQETRGPDAWIGKVGREIIQRPLHTIAA